MFPNNADYKTLQRKPTFVTEREETEWFKHISIMHIYLLHEYSKFYFMKANTWPEKKNISLWGCHE